MSLFMTQRLEHLERENEKLQTLSRQQSKEIKELKADREKTMLQLEIINGFLKNSQNTLQMVIDYNAEGSP